MSLFSRIRDSIFGHKAEAKPAAPAPRAAPAAPKPAAPAAPAPAKPAAAPAPKPEPVDVEAVLEAKAAADGRKLNWRTSIVDLMKLLGMESSLAERKELAQELGYTGALDGSAEMNIWLHKAVMRGLEKNGGKVPKAMLD